MNPATRTLRRSTLVPTGFGTPSIELPKSFAPRWMRTTAIASVIVTLVVTGATLLGPMDESVLANGVVRPADYDLVFARQAGTVAEVLVSAGDEVRTGQVLARLDTFALRRERGVIEAELAQAEADLAEAEAQARSIEAAPMSSDLLLQAQNVERQTDVLRMRRELLTRLEQLGSENAVPLIELLRERLGVKAAEIDLDRATQARSLLTDGYATAQKDAMHARATAARAQVDGIARRLRELDEALGRHEIIAPGDGTLVARSLRFPGERVDLGVALFKIAKGKAMLIRLYASEDRVDRIKPGMTVRFRSRSDPNRLSPMSIGHVAEVALDRDLAKEDTERAERRSGSYAIDVTVAELNSELPLGAAVDAEILLSKRPFWRLLMLREEPPK